MATGTRLPESPPIQAGDSFQPDDLGEHVNNSGKGHPNNSLPETLPRSRRMFSSLAPDMTSVSSEPPGHVNPAAPAFFPNPTMVHPFSPGLSPPLPPEAFTSYAEPPSDAAPAGIGGQQTYYSPGVTNIAVHAGSQLERILREHDENKILNINSDIDTLLVFAGLFSAIVTAFNIESYKTLQEGPGDLPARILTQILQQLTINGINSTANSIQANQPNTAAQFRAPLSAVRINTLWFASLVFSLVTASLAMFVKQWLREYLSWGCTTPEERIRIRYVRYEGLLRWRVFEIAALLPLLLQIALGLSDFLRTFHPVVGWIITGLIIGWLSLYAATIFAPVVSTSCPYKTPSLYPLLQIIRGFIARLRHGRTWRKQTGCPNSYFRFPGDERGVRRDGTLDVLALVASDKTLGDDSILASTLRSCVELAKGEDTVQFVRAVLQHRLSRPVLSLTDILDFEHIPSAAFLAVADILIDSLKQERLKPLVRWQDWMGESLVCLSSAVLHAQSRGRYNQLLRGRSAAEFLELISMDDPEIVQETLIILANDFPFGLWVLNRNDARYNNPKIVRNFLNAARGALDTSGVDPVGLCHSFLSLLNAISNVNPLCLGICSYDISHLQTVLVEAIQIQIVEENLRLPPTIFHNGYMGMTPSSYVESILSLCGWLNEKGDDCIDRPLMDIIASLEKHFSAMVLAEPIILDMSDEISASQSSSIMYGRPGPGDNPLLSSSSMRMYVSPSTFARNTPVTPGNRATPMYATYNPKPYTRPRSPTFPSSPPSPLSMYGERLSTITEVTEFEDSSPPSTPTSPTSPSYGATSTTDLRENV